MFNRKVHRAVAAWLAILAVVIASVAPAISHAFARPAVPSYSDDHKADHHSAAGESDPEDFRSTDADNGQAHSGAHDPSSSPALHMEHCPFCHLHADALHLPAVALRFLPADSKPVRPLLFFLAPSLLHAWRSAQPRAPPAVC